MEHSEPFIIDKQCYKIMKYIYRHKEVTIGELREKFGKDKADYILYLCPAHYAAYRDVTGKLTYDISSTSHDGLIGLTPNGNKYIEDRRDSFIKWIIPTLISILALVTSVSALITSMSNEITVYLAK
jgi:hypothetical protein